MLAGGRGGGRGMGNFSEEIFFPASNCAREFFGLFHMFRFSVSLCTSFFFPWVCCAGIQKYNGLVHH